LETAALDAIPVTSAWQTIHVSGSLTTRVMVHGFATDESLHSLKRDVPRPWLRYPC